MLHLIDSDTRQVIDETDLLKSPVGLTLVIGSPGSGHRIIAQAIAALRAPLVVWGARGTLTRPQPSPVYPQYERPRQTLFLDCPGVETSEATARVFGEPLYEVARRLALEDHVIAALDAYGDPLLALTRFQGQLVHRMDLREASLPARTLLASMSDLLLVQGLNVISAIRSRTDGKVYVSQRLLSNHLDHILQEASSARIER